MCRKRLAMLTSRENVPRTLFMQISAALPKIIFLAISPSIMMITDQTRCRHPYFVISRVILAVLSWDKLEKLRGFVWVYLSDLFSQ